MLDIKYRLRKRLEKTQTWIAWKMPRWLAYWCAVRVISAATVGKYSSQIVTDLTAMEALRRWDDEPKR